MKGGHGGISYLCAHSLVPRPAPRTCNRHQHHHRIPGGNGSSCMLALAHRWTTPKVPPYLRRSAICRTCCRLLIHPVVCTGHSCKCPVHAGSFLQRAQASSSSSSSSASLARSRLVACLGFFGRRRRRRPLARADGRAGGLARVGFQATTLEEPRLGRKLEEAINLLAYLGNNGDGNLRRDSRRFDSLVTARRLRAIHYSVNAPWHVSSE